MTKQIKSKTKETIVNREDDTRVREGTHDMSMVNESVHDNQDWDKPFVPRGKLEIPEDIKAHFAGLGFELFWGRWMDPNTGEPDIGHLGDLDYKGYTFVRREDLPENFLKGLQKTHSAAMGDILHKGDVALMKINSVRKQRIKEYKANKAEAQLKGINDRLDAHGFSKLNKSKSEVLVGKKSRDAQFD